MNRIERTAGLAVLLAAMALCACSRESAGDARAAGLGAGPGKPVAVSVATVATAPWTDTIEALGTTVANESVTITAKVTETVDRVNFEDGDYVEVGAVLIDLSGGAELAELAEARAAFKEAEQQYTRLSGLVQQGTIARAQLDTQVALRDAARARMDTIRARLSDRVITAPFDGVLGFRQVSPGGLVTPGTVIATLDDISSIKLDFSVPETFLAALKQGQTINALTAAFADQQFTGTVSSVDSRVDPVTRAVTVRAVIPNVDRALKPGMLMTVRLLRPERQALVIPELALVQIGTEAFVFRVGAGETVEQVRVTPGARRRGELEIIEGLVAGDRIVVEGTGKVRAGARVVATAPPGGKVAAAVPTPAAPVN